MGIWGSAMALPGRAAAAGDKPLGLVAEIRLSGLIFYPYPLTRSGTKKMPGLLVADLDL